LALRLGADFVCEKPSRKEELAEVMRRIEVNIFRRSPIMIPTTRTTTASMPVELSSNRIISRKGL